MKILFLAAEAEPVIKVGGLADVVGSLPAVLAAQGHDVRIMLPAYTSLTEQGIVGHHVGPAITVPALGEKHRIEVTQTILPGHQTPLYLLHWPGQFLGGAYVTGQDPAAVQEGVRRFVLWSWAVAHALPALPWQPDLIHCHDWHAAGVPAFCQVLGHQYPSILTIHNLSIQGKWNPPDLLSWVGLTGAEHALLATRDQTGDINMMQLGIIGADAVTTVSPQYAQEIVTPAFGERLDSALAARGVLGIVNGLDHQAFNPSTDRHIHQQYTGAEVAAGKLANKVALRAAVGLRGPSDRPLFAFIGRLTPQKGADWIIDCLDRFGDAEMVFLGTGQPELEQKIKQAADHQDHIAAVLRFDAPLGQQLYAGADFLLMPSRFEPCGLGQLIAMRYGTIPVVRDTGGLHDTVVDVAAAPGKGTGIVYTGDGPGPLWQALDRAQTLYRQPAERWAAVRRSMSWDSSWYTSARSYEHLYASIIHHHST